MSPASARAENLLLVVLIQLIAIIASARLFGRLFRRMGQPLVCGEIAAGLILGPSLFGGLFPDLFQNVFNPAVAPTFSILSQIGLMFLMFLIGLEFDFAHLKDNRGAALSVSIVGIVLPFTLGFALGHWMHGALALSGSWINFALFMSAAMSITAIPVLGRIMLELNITRTRIGSITISAAAVDDATGWILLAAITAVVRSTLDPVKFGLMVVETISFAALMVWVVRPLLKRWIRKVMSSGRGISFDALALLLVGIMLAGIATNVIGIFSIFGAFFLGAILYDETEFREAIQERLRDFVTVFFLPIFFTYTGLRTDVGTLSGRTLWPMCGLVLAAAVIGKFGGCTLAARGNGVSWRESAIIGVMMNTRGLMELIVINMGYDLGILPKSVFCMLVIMAVLTTYMTTPLLRRLIRSTELEPYYIKSQFMQGLRP
ncbi:MAG: cation:proton antiporter [Acidobacteria bacterium]|nr:cation:proton antiporter [Acidobacteriota bacterium]